MFNKSEQNLPDQNSSSTIIGKGSLFEGNVETAGNLRVEGKLKGTIKTKAKIALGESSLVDGDIIARNAEIEGEVKGKVRVSEVLILGPRSVVHGDIITDKLIVKDGATFNGGCTMGKASKEILLGENNKAKMNNNTPVRAIN